MAVCISVSVNEARIRKLFSYKVNNQFVPIDKANLEGIYSIQLWDKGFWKDIIIDDLFPCNSKNIPLLTRQKSLNIWLILLEKAYAKLCSSFLKLENLPTDQVLRNLTGAPTISVKLDLSIMNSLWEELEKAGRHKFITTATTPTKVNKDFGLNREKIYTILGVYSVNYGERSVKLIKLKNPIDTFEWIGEWNDFDSKWNRVSMVDKSRVGYIGAVIEGIFFMEYADFFQLFEGVHICYINDEYHLSSIEFTTREGEGKYYQVFLPFKGEYIFTVSQDDAKHLSVVEERNHSYARITLKLGDEKGNILDEIIRDDRDVFTGYKNDQIPEKNELQGNVYIFVRADSGKNISHSLALSCYGLNKVEFQEVKKEKANNLEEKGIFLKKIEKKEENLVKGGKIMMDYKNNDNFSFIPFENYSAQGQRKSIVDRISLSPGLTFSKLISGKKENEVLVRKTENGIKSSRSLL